MVTLWAVHSCARLQRVASAARLSPCTWWRGGRVARRLHCRRQAARLASFPCGHSRVRFLSRCFASARICVRFARRSLSSRSLQRFGVRCFANVWPPSSTVASQRSGRKRCDALVAVCPFSFSLFWGTGFGILVFWRGGVRGCVWALFLCWFVSFSLFRLPHLSLLLAVICAVAGVQSTLSVSRRGAGSAFGFCLLFLPCSSSPFLGCGGWRWLERVLSSARPSWSRNAGAGCGVFRVSVSCSGYLVDPASSHMLVSKIKPCMSKYKRLVL